MRLLSTIFLFLAPVAVLAQAPLTDSVHELSEYVVSGFQSIASKRTSINIEPYSLKQLNEKNPFNLSDALAKLPGISQMTTGNSISKPVIRGLYGNRILLLFSGLRFDNQQWQDEHGLGLSQIGIDRVEVIKGPASLLYGSDAMGGVINIIERKPITEGKKLDAGTQLFSNTHGTLTDIGYSNRNGDNWWRLRLGAESHADYTDGDGSRVLNSRNNGYYLKAGLGFDKKNWKQENSYNFSYNQYGFIMEDLLTTFTPDNRWSRAMAGPHHIVILNLLNSQNTFLLEHSLLKLNVGAQSNVRMEDEGGGQISLNMHLFSGLQNLKWEKQLNDHITFVANQQLTYENNTNYGGRIIIPDATFVENNVSGYWRFNLHKFIIEAGAGGNDKYVKTIETRSLNTPGEPIQPFTKNDLAGNGMAGVAFNPAEWLTIKTNSSTGTRTPNLAELSSNGLHEGVYRYEIGDPNLKHEENINTDLTIEASNDHVFFSASVFYNRFLNYVYLAPTTQSYFGFPVFRYKQNDATISGGELFCSIAPTTLKGVQLKEGFSATNGMLDIGGYLPFIPAYKSATSVRYEKNIGRKIRYIFVEPEVVYVFKQDRAAQFETPTGSYTLINATCGLTITGEKGDWLINLSGTNLGNKAYMDHLSRLKYYGLYNQGINFVLSARKELKW